MAKPAFNGLLGLLEARAGSIWRLLRRILDLLERLSCQRHPIDFAVASDVIAAIEGDLLAYGLTGHRSSALNPVVVELAHAIGHLGKDAIEIKPLADVDLADADEQRPQFPLAGVEQ